MDFDTHGPLGILWVGIGLSAFYVALIWINTLLGVFLTPLFIVPLTWLQDRVMERRGQRARSGDGQVTAATTGTTTSTATSTATGTTPAARDARDPRGREPRPR